MWWRPIGRIGWLWLVSAVSLAQAQGLSPRDEALQYFETSERLYEQGDYQGSLNYLEEAYRLQPSPTLLYNMARTREKLDLLPEALATYEAYLTESPNADNREQVQMRIATLQKELAERERLRREREAAGGAAGEGAYATTESSGWDAGPTRDEAAEPSSRGERAGPGPWPWVMAGVGAASLVTAGALFATAGARHDEAVSATSQRSAFDLQSSAETLATGSTVATVAGVVLLGAGGLWGVMSLLGRSGDDAGDDAAALEPLLGPGAAGLRGRF